MLPALGKAEHCLWSKYGLCSDLGMIDSDWDTMKVETINYVIESYEQQKRENAIALLKLLMLSAKDKAEGRVFSKEQLLDGL
jgi:hypothetical protein